MITDDKKQFYKTLPTNTFKELSAKAFAENIKKEAMQKEHDRKQQIENAKADAVSFCIKYLPHFVLILLFTWVICSIADAFEIKKGVECAIAFIFNLLLGTLIGKHIV